MEQLALTFNSDPTSKKLVKREPKETVAIVDFAITTVDGRHISLAGSGHVTIIQYPERTRYAISIDVGDSDDVQG